MAIKIEMLRTFAAVASHGGLGDAAAALGRTPSAVSMMLKQFEDHIGAPLFEASRKARLTPLGEAVLREAERELSHFERTVAVIEGLSRAEMGFVRLAVTPSVAMAVMPPIIDAFLRSHPKVRIEMRDMTSTDVRIAMEQDQADLGLATLATHPTLECRPFLKDRFGVVCRADHPLVQDWDNLSWSDMIGQEFIANDLCTQINDPAFAPILQAARLTVPNTAGLLALVRAGIGITILPQLVALTDSQGLAFLPLRDLTAERQVSLITPPRAHLTPVALAFANAVQAAQAVGLPFQFS